DEISSLDGLALVKSKAVRWVCMGGRYPNREKKTEANFHTFGGSDYTKKVVDMWPLPAVFSGGELGSMIMTGPELDRYGDENPVRKAYRLYFESPGRKGWPNRRQSWDQTAVLFAVRGASDCWTVKDEGYNFIHPNGLSEWRQSPDKEHAYLAARKSPQQIAEIIGELMSQPPMVSR
ncbi:MAG: hypothetical protein KAT00_10750, partial [Planctomycetes bacterium]|nr:hypothetical protein [Planctomycetota bacterium]